MKRINVDICMGTTCHIFGASDILRVEEMLAKDLLARVDIRGVPCLSACHDDNFGGAPFVRVGDKMISKADVNSVMEEIQRQLEDTP